MTHLLPLIFLLSCFSMPLRAHLGESFGASAKTASLGNQAAINSLDPAVGYYAGALTASMERATVSFSVFQITPEFNPIQNIVIRNSANSSTFERGNVNTDYNPRPMASLAALLPLEGETLGSLLVHVFTPIGSVAHVNSGDQFLPEYVMYRSRLERTNAMVQYIQPLNGGWALALGGQLGFQVGSDVGTQTSLNGAPYGSSSTLKADVKPTLGALISLAHQGERHHVYLSYQQEMKTNLRATASGEINNPTSAVFSIALESMSYYDPHIIRAGLAYQFQNGLDVHLGADYQIWSGYQTPVIRIRDRGGIILPSDDYERVSTKNVFIPRVGTTYHFNEMWALSAGAFLRPSPLEGDFSGSGNSIDTDLWALSFGPSMKTQLFNRPLELALALQYQKLEDKAVTKLTGQENGSAGERIGSPGYSVGGEIMVVGFGVNFRF